MNVSNSRYRNIRRNYLTNGGISLSEVRKGVYSPTFEEPTYLTFKIEFGLFRGNSFWDADIFRNPSFENNLLQGTYDLMPHPLFQLPSGNIQADKTDPNVISSYEWLRDSNQSTRAEMLLDFIGGLQEIQSEYPYFFQKISGLDTLLSIDPKQGQRIKGGKIRIECLDSIDQRVRHLLSLYRRIVWDDNYQRWALPDMMRYFKMYIYISEIRSFHASSIKYVKSPDRSLKNMAKRLKPITKGLDSSNLYGIDVGADTRFKNITDYKLSDLVTSGVAMYLEAIDHIAPVTLIECSMCDIDPNSLNLFDSDYGANNDTASTISFSVNVRNVRVINGFNLLTTMLNSHGVDDNGNPIGDNISEEMYKRMPFAKTHSPNNDYYNPMLSSIHDDDIVNVYDRNVADTNVANNHLSEYIHLINTTRTFNDNIKLSPSDLGHIAGTYFNVKDTSVEYTDNPTDASSNPIKSETLKWVGKAVDWGANRAGDYIKNKVDKIKNAEIGGTGLSLNRIVSAIGSKDAVAIFGMIKDAMDGEFRKNYSITSKESGQIFEDVLQRISEQNPTDESQATITETAKQILNNTELLDSFKKYSTEEVLSLLQSGKIHEDVTKPNTPPLVELIKPQRPNDVPLVGELVGSDSKFEVELPTMTGNEPFRDIELSSIIETNYKADIEMSGLTGANPNTDIPMSGLSGQTPNLDIPLHRLSGEDPNIDIQMTNLSGNDPNINIPMIGLSGEDPNINIPMNGLTGEDPNINIPMSKLDGNEPNINIQMNRLTGVDPNLDVPMEKMIGAEPNINIPMNKLDGNDPNLDVPMEKMRGAEPNINIPMSKLDGETPNISIPMEKMRGNDIQTNTIPMDRMTGENQKPNDIHLEKMRGGDSTQSQTLNIQDFEMGENTNNTPRTDNRVWMDEQRPIIVSSSENRSSNILHQPNIYMGNSDAPSKNIEMISQRQVGNKPNDFHLEHTSESVVSPVPHNILTSELVATDPNGVPLYKIIDDKDMDIKNQSELKLTLSDDPYGENYTPPINIFDMDTLAKTMRGHEHKISHNIQTQHIRSGEPVPEEYVAPKTILKERADKETTSNKEKMNDFLKNFRR